jgi:hypothetical protein
LHQAFPTSNPSRFIQFHWGKQLIPVAWDVRRFPKKLLFVSLCAVTKRFRIGIAVTPDSATPKNDWSDKMKTNSQSWAIQIRHLICLVVAVAVIGLLTLETFARGPQMKAAAKVSPSGDAEINVDFELPIQKYSLVKQGVGNATYLARTMGDQLAWSEIRDLRGAFDDGANAVNASLKHIGYAKPYADGKWMIDMEKENLTLVAIANNVAHFSSVMENAELGAVNVLVSIEMPAGSTNHKFDASKNRLTYNFVPEFVEGDSGNVDFEIDSKHEIMSSMAKIYGDEVFDNFWVSRAKLKNTGDQVIHDYRVRFRIANLSAWSSWKKTKVVYPGQTVIDPFFPVLDIEQLAQITDTRNAMIEVEYEYEMGGEKISDSDSDKIKVLSRNQVLWGSRSADETLNWYENFDNSKVIGAVFCNSNDPVIQQIAGTVSGMAGGNTQASDEGAILYLRTMWKFMEMNKISYQSPPGDLFDGHYSQHVKYGRDVIRNRAGTCVDLAIFWTATAKAVGLKSHLVCVPGHVFPVIELPQSGQLLALESTMIMNSTFDEAWQRGFDELAIARGEVTQDAQGNPIANAGVMIWCDINELQNSGVHCLDLPVVESNYLRKLGYKLEMPEIRETGMREENQVQQPEQKQPQQTQQVKRQLTRDEQQLVGVWQCSYDSNGQTVEYVLAFADNTGYAALVQVSQNGEVLEKIEAQGTWRIEGKTLFIDTDKADVTHQFRFTPNGQMILSFEGSEYAFSQVDVK